MMLKKIKKGVKFLIPKHEIEKVSLFTVGAQKAGTSALHNYLTKHNAVQGGSQKELNFFNHSEKYKKGEEWYRAQFKPAFFYQQKPIYIDSTPQYLNETEIAKKIHDYNPHAKIVILLREPVSRAFSAWNMYKQFSELKEEKKEKLIKRHIPISQAEKFKKVINLDSFPTFDDYVKNELKNGKLNEDYLSIIGIGLYSKQVKAYIDTFGIENVFIFESNYFKNNKLSVTNMILKSLNLRTLEKKNIELKNVHSRSYRNSITEETKEKLKLFYAPYNKQLFQLINQKFDW